MEKNGGEPGAVAGLGVVQGPGVLLLSCVLLTGVAFDACIVSLRQIPSSMQMEA